MDIIDVRFAFSVRIFNKGVPRFVTDGVEIVSLFFTDMFLILLRWPMFLIRLWHNMTSQYPLLETNYITYISQKLLPEASFGLQILSLPASVCLSVCQSLACPRDNSGPVQTRITKFGPKMEMTLVKVPIVLWTDRPWPSMSNLTWMSKFTPFWAFPHHN